MNISFLKRTTMIKSSIKNIFQYQNARNYTYKPIKRPVLTNLSKKNESNQDKIKTPAEQAMEQSLADRIITRIRTGGPITVAQYMSEVLTNPLSGYYMSKDVFGMRGDFITSPEIGQIFGELIAVWLYSEWQKCGSPKPLQIIELGPGRGTLSQDILRVLSKLESSQNNFSLHLVEVSPYLSELQAQRICFKSHNCRIDMNNNDENSLAQQLPATKHYREGETVSGIPVYWYERIEHVPNEFSIILAHEFFDAMPINKFQKINNKWHEILVDFIDNEKKFKLIASRNETPMLRLFKQFLNPNDTRDHIEHSFQTQQIIEIIAKKLEEFGGFSLIMDYGNSGLTGDTFRAFKNHKLHDPMLQPGTADLTADVDFNLIKQTAELNGRLITFGPVEQEIFLKKMGGDIRLQHLVSNAQPENVEALNTGYEMLTSPQKMGNRFKFFSMFPMILKEHLTRFPVHGFD